MKKIVYDFLTRTSVEVDLTPEEIEEIENNQNTVRTPQSVTMRQARKALLRAGKLNMVETAISSMQGQTGQEARIEWEYSNEVLRNQPLTLALAQIIGLNDQEMDELFRTAATL